MRVGISKTLITIAVLSMISQPVFAESLFKTGITHNAYPIHPKSLFSSVKAKSIGDLVTVLISEQVTSSDSLNFSIEDETENNEGFADYVNKIGRHLLNTKRDIIPTELAEYGGDSSTGNTANVKRTTSFEDTITAQVVQILPNGNLVIQGKKTAINSGERVEVLLSGVIDPRFLDGLGRINSNQVANLQLAMIGKGSVAESGREGVVNKFMRSLY